MRYYKITQTENGIDTIVCSDSERTAIKTFNNLFRSLKARADLVRGVRIEETPDSFTFIYPKSERLPEGYVITLKIEEE